MKLELLLRIPQLSRIEDELVTPGERRVGLEEKAKRVLVEAALAKAATEAAATAAARATEAEQASADEEDGEGED